MHVKAANVNAVRRGMRGCLGKIANRSRRFEGGAARSGVRGTPATSDQHTRGTGESHHTERSVKNGVPVKDRGEKVSMCANHPRSVCHKLGVAAWMQDVLAFPLERLASPRLFLSIR